jgi:hypothetical protein
MLESYLWFDSKNIKVGFQGKDRKFVKITFTGLEETIKFLSVYFHLERNFPSIRTILAPNREEYDLLVKKLLKVNIETPSNPSRIAQPQRTDLVLLAPSAYSTDSIYKYSPREYKRLLFHEVTHMFEEYLSPNIELTPRWWSEGLAVYLSKQWKHEDELKGPVLKGCRNKKIPNFRKIKKDVKFSYQWGWTIVMFIENTYGKEMILKIVRECDNGNVFGMLGENFKNFEKRWNKWLLESWKNSFNFA